MIIKSITIAGEQGEIIIERTESGAAISTHDVRITIDRRDSDEDQFDVAWNAAKVIYGTTKRDEPNATNSMIHDIWREMQRVAGC